MADESGKTDHNPDALSSPFDWDEFNGILDGLAISHGAQAIADNPHNTGKTGGDNDEAGPDTGAEAPGAAGPQARESEDLPDSGIADAAPNTEAVRETRPNRFSLNPAPEPLPRVEPDELLYHKAKARRRRVLVRRTGTPTRREGRDHDFGQGRGWAEQERTESLAARPAPTSADNRAHITGAGASRSRAVSGRRAPPGLSAFDRALENEMRELADMNHPVASTRPGAPAPTRLRAPSPAGTATYRDSFDDSADFVHQSAPAEGDRGRIMIFGAIAIVAMLLSGVSAVALFSGSNMRISGIRSASVAPESTPVLSVARAPRAEEHTGTVTLKPILSPDKQAGKPVEPMTPRRVTTTRIGPKREARPQGDTRTGAATPPIAAPARPLGTRPVAADPANAEQAGNRSANPDAIALATPGKIRGEPARQGVGQRPPQAAALPPEADPAPAEVDLRILSPVGSEPEDDRARQRRRQLDVLLERGRLIMETGDIASARLIYERVYEAGDPRGALAIASTYDPETLRAFNVIGLAADRDMYRLWSQRAEELANRTGSRFVVGNR